MKSFNNDWEIIHKTTEWGQYPSEHVIRFVARNYYKMARNKVKILDFGCGAGAHTWYLAREGFDTYAFDGAESAIQKAEKKLEKENLKAHFAVQDALETNYPNDFFDAVIDNVCIYSNKKKDISQMYSNIYKMLKPSGKLLTVCFSNKTVGYGMGEEIEKDTYINIKVGGLAGRGTTHFFSIEELREMLQIVGFNNINIDIISYTDNGLLVEQLVAVCDK
jgi:ubiquinone/menaquinone biosynthesis C-methylase UbiE